jgi:hypothetical protein
MTMEAKQKLYKVNPIGCRIHRVALSIELSEVPDFGIYSNLTGNWVENVAVVWIGVANR